MKAYKGFDKDLKCRGFQYEVGKEYQEPVAALCSKGFHACENPLDTFRYYPPTDSRYCEVEIDDNGQRNSDDSKVCGEKIKIGAEVGLGGVIKAGAQFIREVCTGTTEDHASGERGNAAASGWSGNAVASGLSGTATATGRDGRASAVGTQCIAVAWGQDSLAKGTLGNWIVVSERDDSGDIVDAKLARVDGEIIKPDTWYTLRNGKIMEAE
nr:MAG TPA: hypothetical protein [Caudoviricetes sp.]